MLGVPKIGAITVLDDDDLRNGLLCSFLKLKQMGVSRN